MDDIRTVKEIDQEISRLQAMRLDLYIQEIATFTEKAKENIGRCFIVDGKYAKVLDVPQTEYMRTKVDFNRYQYPALWIDNDPNELVPFHEDTIFSGYWGDGNDPLHSSVQEISNEEFKKEYLSVLHEFQNKIGVE